MENQALEEQARKISSLLGSYEKLGAQAEKSSRLMIAAETHRAAVEKHLAIVDEKLLDAEKRLSAALQSEETLKNELSELREAKLWKEMCLARLGPTREAADKQIDLFYEYAHQMAKPGHRVVSFVTRRIKCGWFFCAIRRVRDFAVVLRRA